MERTRAYTLIELVVVVGIILVLAVLTAPALAPLLRRRALSQGVMAMQAALVRARAAAISQEPNRIPVMPVCVRAQPPQWGIPTARSDWFGVEGGATDEEYPDGSSTGTGWSDGGMSGKCWSRSGVSAVGGEYTYGFTGAEGNKRIQVADGDILGMWAYVGANVTGFGFTLYADDDDTITDEESTGTAYWGTGMNTDVDWGDWLVEKGELPQKGKWVQVAASIRELGVEDNWYLTGIKFRVCGGASDYVYWDRVVLWKNAYMLPDFIVPDTSQFPIEFEKDGRLKACRVGTSVSTLPAERDSVDVEWFDRLIILKDVRNRQLQEYLKLYDLPSCYGGDNDGFWECEAYNNPDGWGTGMTGANLWDYGLDRVKGTSATGDVGEGDANWDFEGDSGGGLTEPTVPPTGQIYIKINKITGMIKTCAHPGE